MSAKDQDKSGKNIKDIDLYAENIHMAVYKWTLMWK